MTHIAVSVQDGAARIALLNGDTLTEYALWDPARPDGVGDLFTGRVTARVPALAGSFIDMGGPAGAMPGFLPDSAGASRAHVGQLLAVAVARAAQGGKGPRLRMAPHPPAATAGLHRRGPGPLVELAERFPAARLVIDDHAFMARLRPAFQDRLDYRKTAFDPILEDEIADLALPTAALPCGALMHIAPSPALTAIDIDSAAASADTAPKSHAQLTLNTALLPELARQIVLRNLAGAILIDFAGMKPRARAGLLAPLGHALAADPLKPRLLGLTALGFAEISRPRIRPPLHEQRAVLSARA